jgi:hypothetical protein
VSTVPNRHEKWGVFPLSIPVRRCKIVGGDRSILAMRAAPSHLVVATQGAPMDGSQFDSLTRSLSDSFSRRDLARFLGGLALSGALALLGLTEAEGKRKKKKRKKRRAKSPPPSPCQGQPDDTPCNGTGRCLGGVCNPEPRCIGAVGSSCLADSDCCSGRCGIGGSCVLSTVGQPCFVAGDCYSERCVGYRCAQGATADGAQCSGNAQCPFCSSDELCASGQCGCTGAGANTQCTCRRAACSSRGTPCDPANAEIDCCEGGCTGIVVGTGETVCD